MTNLYQIQKCMLKVSVMIYFCLKSSGL